MNDDTPRYSTKRMHREIKESKLRLLEELFDDWEHGLLTLTRLKERYDSIRDSI